MNFNFLVLIFILIALCGCGVKGNPEEPKNSPNPSILDNYPDIEFNQDPEDKKKF